MGAAGCSALRRSYNVPMERDIERILISRKCISERVSALADSIGETYGADSEGLVIVPILAGSVIFLADLIRCLPFKMKIGLMTVSSYRGKTTSAGESRLIQDLNLDIEDRHVLVVDDILDTGSTLRLVVGELRQRRPASVRICVLLRKRSKAPRDFSVDFVGFDIEDVFVVGYGLDYNDHYRNWPDIGVLKPELYE
ncbi:MAG: hypoxanthine phosphoribosyltransferase [Planctomycetota bacterium]|nr:hypoxanthine phosphoribosyltransferase [Planctomycetota bacterium]